MTTTFIHCIESKHDNKFERQAILFNDSMKQTNMNLFNTTEHFVLQPTTNDILESTIQYFDENNIQFLRHPLDNKQRNETFNFTNVCNTSYYLSTLLTTEYMCWVDVDVVFTKKVPDGDFFQPTTKPAINAMRLEKEDMLDIPSDGMDNIDIRYHINFLYDTFFRQHLPSEFIVDSLTHYVNTWFIYAPTKHSFWKQWVELTTTLIEIVHEHHPSMIKYNLEAFCEELAASVLYCRNPKEYDIKTEVFGEIFAMTSDKKIPRLNANTCLYHYTSTIDDDRMDILKYNDSDVSYRSLLDHHRNKNIINELEYMKLLHQWFNND